MTEDLSQRARQILAAVIANYIQTAEPVGSGTIAQKSGLNISPATVRSVMADLEGQGLLTQPHVSAGRMPTSRGLRLYVNSILQVQDLDHELKQRLKSALKIGEEAETAEVLKATSKALSDFSMQVAVVAAPSPAQEIFQHMELILLNPGLILVVLVSKGGAVQNRIIQTEPQIVQEDLDKYTRYLNELLADLSLCELRDRMITELAQERARFDLLMQKALTLGEKALGGGGQGDIFIEGRSNLLGAPEFADITRLRQVFQAFDEKSTLLRLLEKALAAQGVRIFIGAESELAELDGLTVVTAPYGGDQAPLGALAVIGPNRMDYSQVIPMVDYTAHLVGDILTRRRQGVKI